MRRVLEQFTRVQEAAEALEQPAAAPAAAEEAPAAGAAPAEPPAAAAGLLETVVGAEACRHLDPWAAFLHAHLAAAAPPLGELVGARALLAALAALALLSTLRLVIDMLLFIHHASAHPKDTIGLLTHLLFRASTQGCCALPARLRQPACLCFDVLRTLLPPAAPRFCVCPWLGPLRLVWWCQALLASVP